MAADVFDIMQKAIRSCVNWTTSLFDATGMGGIITAVFILGLIISFFLMPLRGVYVHAGDAFSEFSSSTIHNYKASKPGRERNRNISKNVKTLSKRRKYGGM